MPPFRFPLEQVLKYRTQLEEQAKVELARVENERRKEEEHAARLENSMDEQTERLSSLGLNDQGDRWVTENYIKALKTDLHIARQRIANWTLAVEAARQELLNRAKDKKILEKLKETQAEHHAKEELYREQKEYDETASIRFKAAR